MIEIGARTPAGIFAPICLFLIAFGCASTQVGLGGSPSTSPIVLTNDGQPVLALGTVEERFQPAFEALQSALSAGDDREARAVLDRLYALGPTGTALEFARGFGRILDGRAAVSALDLALDAQFIRPPGGGSFARVSFVATARDGRNLVAHPGPGVLHVTVLVIDPAGALSRRVEVVPLDTIKELDVGPDRPARIDLVELPVVLPAGALALRAVFEVDLRAGSMRSADEVVPESSRDRDLPAMRWHVESSEVAVLAKELASQDLAAPGDLAQAALEGKIDRRKALVIAVRLPRADRDAALDELSRVSRQIAEPVISALGPALRWLATDVNLGEDTDAWRAFLRERAKSLQRESDLRLPRPVSSALAESPRGN